VRISGRVRYSHFLGNPRRWEHSEPGGAETTKTRELTVELNGAATGLGRLPLHEEGGHGAGFHAAHGPELAGLLAVEQLAMLIQNSQRGHAGVDRNLIAGSEIEILILVADVDVDEDVVRVQDGSIGLVVEVDIQHMAVGAPVRSEIENHTLVGGAGCLEPGEQIGFGLLRLRVDGWGGGAGGQDCERGQNGELDGE